MLEVACGARWIEPRASSTSESLKPHSDVSGRGPSWLAPLLVAVIWGVNVPVMKAALEHVHPFAFNALRLSSSAIVLGLIDRRERARSGARALPRTPWRVVVPLALLTSLLYQVLFVGGMANTSATHTGLLVASGPLWTAAIARAFGLERVSTGAWISLGVAFVGTCIVVVAKGGGEGGSPPNAFLGNGLLLVAMILWALGAVVSRPVLTTLSATRLAFLSTAIALPGHWLLALPHLDQLRVAAGSGLGVRGWLAVLYSGALSTGVAFALWNRSLMRIGPARTSAFTNLVPLVAIALAWATLGERPGALQLAGGALVLVGVSALRAVKVRAA